MTGLNISLAGRMNRGAGHTVCERGEQESRGTGEKSEKGGKGFPISKCQFVSKEIATA